MKHDFGYLLLFVLIGTVLVYIIEWAKNKARPTNYVDYGLAAGLGCLAAYFIAEKVVQAIIMIGVVVAGLWVAKGLGKIVSWIKTKFSK